MNIELLGQRAVLEGLKLYEGQGEIKPLTQVKIDDGGWDTTHIIDTGSQPDGFVLIGSQESVYKDQELHFATYHSNTDEGDQWVVEKQWVNANSGSGKGVVYRFDAPPGPGVITKIYLEDDIAEFKEGEKGFVDMQYL